LRLQFFFFLNEHVFIILDARYWMLDTRYWILKKGRRSRVQRFTRLWQRRRRPVFRGSRFHFRSRTAFGMCIY